MPFLKPVRISSTKWRTEASKRNGLRHEIFAPGRENAKKRYMGEWLDDKKHGKGTEFDMHNSLLYEGDWLKGAKHGYGVLSIVTENNRRRKIYSGYWANGKRHGCGNFWYENGDYYEGEFLENRRNGFGRMWMRNGTFYRGTWKNDVFHGKGIIVLANGNSYDGNFTSGEKQGSGYYHHAKTGQLQEGRWSADTCRSGTIVDTYSRQSAPEPTPYPIPIFQGHD